MKKGLSIQIKILSLFLSLIIITAGVNTFASFQISGNALEDEIRRSLAATTGNIEYSLDTFFKSFDDGISTLSANQNIKDVLAVDYNEKRYVLNTVKVFLDNHSDILNVYVATERKDFFVFPNQDVPAGFDPTSRPWYKEAVSKKGVIWTEPYQDTGTGTMVVSIARPVYNDNDELVGVVGADISLAQLTKMVTSYKIGEKGYFIISDIKGNIIVHPQADKIGKPLATDILRETAASEVLNGTLAYHYNGQKKFTEFTTIQRTGWKLFGTFDHSEVLDRTSVILRDAALISLVLILLAGGMAVFFSRPIIKGIKALSKDMLIIGSGDFTVRSNVKSRDEIGLLSKTLNEMTQELSTIMANIKRMATEVSTSSDSLAASSEESTATSEEIARTIQEIVRVTEDQAFNTEDGLKRTTQLADKIQGVSHEITQISDRIRSANHLNEKGMKSVTVLKNASDATSSVSRKIGEVISKVDKSSQHIGNIVETMSNIADQTNMLALNASIEAARAGESGRGFAVVAEHIRKLAEQSAGASNNIKSLVDEIQFQSKNAVTAIIEAKPIVEAQNTAVFETKTIFDEISLNFITLSEEVAFISELNDTMIQKKDEILSTMESISASAEQTSASTQQIAASTHEQLAASDEVAKTAENLNALAQNLSKEVSRFRV